MADTTTRFRKEWKAYTHALEKLVVVRQRLPNRPFVREYKLFFQESFKAVRSEQLLAQLTAGWQKLESAEDNRELFRLLLLEIEAFNQAYAVVVGTAPESPEPPLEKKFWQRRATAKDMLNAGRTLLGSLTEALNESLPRWARGLLSVLKEVLDVAIG